MNRNRTLNRKFLKHKKSKKSKKNTKKGFELPIYVASEKLKNTGSLNQARKAFKQQAIFDARKLFGSVTI